MGYKVAVEYVQRHLNWIRIRTLGNSRLIKSSYYWLFLVPIAAKFLKHLAGDHALPILGTTFRIHVGLPFSWKVFFFVALSFAVAQFIYWAFCPEIIKQWKNAKAYQTTHPGIEKLRTMIADVANYRSGFTLLQRALESAAHRENKELESSRIEALQSAQWNEFNRFERLPIHMHLGKYMTLCNRKKWEFDDLFNRLQYSFAYHRLWAIYACGVLFLIGFLLFLWVLGENVCFVVSMIRDGATSQPTTST